MLPFIVSTAETYVTATSYLSIADATEIMSSQPDYADWAGLSDTAKQVLLIQSSMTVDSAFGYKGKKTDSSQELKFPRSESVIVPNRVKVATALQCLEFATEHAFKNVTSETIVKMSWTFAPTKNAAYNGMSEQVLSFLRPLKATTIRINDEY